MKHNYGLYKIINPSETHSVPLMPGQDFKLSLLDPNETAEIEFKNDFFELQKREHDKDHTSFTFQQKFDLSQWAIFSKVFLGDILTFYSNKLSNLFVYLDNKDDIYTVVNPNNANIKVSSNSLIEIVVSTPNSLYDWTSNFTSLCIPDAIKQTSYRRVFAYQNIVGQGVPIIHRGTLLNHFGIEHHFWYRVSDEIPVGDHFLGKIILNNSKNDETKTLNVNVTTKKRNSLHLTQRKNKPFRGYYSPTNIAFKRNFGIMKNDVVFSKRENSDLDDHCEAYIMTFEE